MPPGLSGVILCPTGLVSGTTASSSPQAGRRSSSSLKGRQAAPGMRGRAVATGRSGGSPRDMPQQARQRDTSHRRSAKDRPDAQVRFLTSQSPVRRVPDFRLPKVDFGVAALLAHLPNPGLGKLACIWQLSTRPSGSPCLARLGRRSDVTPCYTIVTVHNRFRRAGTTHHGEDHPTRIPCSGRAPSITWRSPTNADARWVVPAAQRPARRLHRMAMESSIEERNVHARPEHRHGHRNSIGTGGRP